MKREEYIELESHRETPKGIIPHQGIIPLQGRLHVELFNRYWTLRAVVGAAVVVAGLYVLVKVWLRAEK